MTARFTIDSPIASTDTWVGRRLEGTATMRAEEIWRENMARRDAAAAAYGEPKTPYEFYAGRPGSKAEGIVLDCLRKLEAIPDPDRLYATELTAAISHVYIETSHDDAGIARRRATQLLEISGDSV